MSTSSHPDHERSPRTAPAIDADRAQRCAEALRDIAEDIVLVAETFMTRASTASAATELLECTTSIGRLTQQATAAIVVGQRSQGEPLGELEPLLNLSVDRLRKKYPPQAVERELAARRRPTPTAPGLPQTTEPTATKPSSLRHPQQRLACALTLMWKQSGISQRELAKHMNIDRSYVSRILSGERPASLPYVKLIADRCGGDAELAALLWEIASGAQDHGTDPVHTLRSYLRALHYAAGSPGNDQILLSTQHTISNAEIKEAFRGPGAPEWAVVQQLATVLQSLPETARPLWLKARSSIKAVSSSYPAEAFG
ncbi:helix-turn-helix transcriptional regulator [Streptomyces clavifer]|uniref:helix-turn-helix domain-containing protein n=1 Tax=Streptomyces TaxID=1883 RepID=UPI0006FC3433|nr:helix-turn-helix transcriptional regulator [Streptomyces sp. Root55]KQZ12113.1 hypothetical protein ASD51_33650 [Streptomyces sp. Root55]